MKQDHMVSFDIPHHSTRKGTSTSGQMSDPPFSVNRSRKCVTLARPFGIFFRLGYLTNVKNYIYMVWAPFKLLKKTLEEF